MSAATRSVQGLGGLPMKYIHVLGYETWHIFYATNESTGSYITTCGQNLGPCVPHLVMYDTSKGPIPTTERVCHMCRKLWAEEQGITQASFLEAHP